MSINRCMVTHFADLPDPHIDRCRRHDLPGTVTIALSGVNCVSDS